MAYTQDNVNHTNINHNGYGNPHPQYIGSTPAASITNAVNSTVCANSNNIVWNALTITLNQDSISKLINCKCICNYKIIMDDNKRISKGEFTIRVDNRGNGNIYSDSIGQYNVYMVNTSKTSKTIVYDIYVEMPSNDSKCYLIKEFEDGENYNIEEHNFKLLQDNIPNLSNTRLLGMIPYDNSKRTKPMVDITKNYIAICQFNSLVALGEKIDTRLRITRYSNTIADCAHADIRIIYDYSSSIKNIHGRIVDMYGLNTTDIIYNIQAGKVTIYAKLKSLGDYYTVQALDTIATTSAEVDSSMKLLTGIDPIGLYDVENPLTFIPIGKTLCVPEETTGSVYELKVSGGKVVAKNI